MIFVSGIPHLKVYKQKANLPTDDKSPTMYSVVFINNINSDSSPKLINNHYLYHNNKFHFYFMDSIYKGKINGKTYREIQRKERENVYSELEDNIKWINGVTNFGSLNGRNFYFELATYNSIYFYYAKKLNNTLKVTTYIDYLKKIINDSRLTQYKYKTIAIGIAEWVTGNLHQANNLRINMNNPMMILYMAMYKNFEKFKELGDINIIFYDPNMILRVNPSLCDEKSYVQFRRELAKLEAKFQVLDDEKRFDDAVKRSDVFEEVSSKFIENYKFTGTSNDNDDELDNSVKERLGDIMEEEKIRNDEPQEDIKKKLEDALVNDQQLLKKVYEINQENKTGRSTASLKRDEELREKQKQLILGKMTLEEIRTANTTNIPIPHIDVAENVSTTNKNMTKVKFPHFEKAYNQQLMKKDLINVITSLNNKSIPVYVRNIDVQDSSDELNYKETYTVQLEDSNRVRHTLKFDMPKFIDDKFMYLGGNKKLIVKQLFMKPVVKTGPDEVQVCSNYNKIFIRRYGNKVSSKIEKFKKAIQSGAKGVVLKYGNNAAANNNYKTFLEYDELAKIYSYIRIQNAEFYFNQQEVEKILADKKITLKDNLICVGFFANEKDPILYDVNTGRTPGSGESWDLVDFMLSIDKGSVQAEFDDASAGKKFMYSRATIMKKQVPVVLLLGYLEGLTTVLKKANIQHQFSDKRPQVDNNHGVIQFADGYLVYDKYPFENSLLMNAFADIPTKAFEYADLDGKDAYLSLFDIMFGNKMIGNAFDNFYEFMIDPITLEVLQDFNYPTDFVSLILFANALLADNSFIKENNMNLYRVRSNEIVNALLYKVIADEYSKYRATAMNNNPVKISVPQDVVTKKLLMLQTVEDYSTLNPIVELEKSRAITPKGHVGMNLDDAYTQDKRSYDKTMSGILSMSTSPDANCGVVRQLTLEPNITSPRGYLDLKDDKLHELSDANLFSPAELLSPLGVTRDDSIRTAMATKQSKHIIPIAKASPVLISNGSEQVIQYHVSNDFIVRAKMDGEIVEVNDKTGLVIAKYKDGTTQVIDTKPRVVKNGAGGFYLSNQLSADLKKGQKFKENDILASDKHFFSTSQIDGNRFNIGSFQKVACMSTYSTYEDSTFVTNKLSKDMTSEIVMQKPVALGKNANVDYMVKIGDRVQVGDELIRFESSFEDDGLNKFLASVGQELKEEIKSLGKTPVKAKYSGIIEDIKIYSTVDLTELSPSLRKIVSDYYDSIKAKKNVINKYDKTDSIVKGGILFNEPTDKIETKDGKIKGTQVDEGVLIEFYIKYKDTIGVGDKVTFFTALKSIVGEVIPEGLEPYSEYRPEEEISSVIAPGAVLARMTPSILLTMFGNKVLVELKRELEEIYTGKPWKPVDEAAFGMLLEATTDDVYRDKNIDDNSSYFTKRPFTAGDMICPVINSDGHVNIVGHYLQFNSNHNCTSDGINLIATRNIAPGEELIGDDKAYLTCMESHFVSPEVLAIEE